jgi:8-amino-7-oxononanoate synthase
MDIRPDLDRLADTMRQWRAEHIYPFFPVISDAEATHASLVDGQGVTVFGSADYLGLAHHPEVVAGAVAAVQRFGTTTYGVQTVSGFTELHRDLESALANYFGKPAAMLFPTGMQANVGIIATLMGPSDAVFTDWRNHGSITMGARLSGAQICAFRHNDVEHLATLLGEYARAGGRRLIVVDGLFSTEGDYPPLAEIAELAEQHNAVLVVDEAHSAGVVGPLGRGAAELFGVLDRVDIIVGTMSKAFGSVGGFACSSQRIIEPLRHCAVAYLLSLGLPPATVGASLAALTVASREGASRRATLHRNAGDLRKRLRETGLDLGATTSHVVPVIIGPIERTARVATWLMQQGLLANPLIPPAVPIGGARLRLGVTSEHTIEDLELATKLVPAALEAVER